MLNKRQQSRLFAIADGRASPMQSPINIGIGSTIINISGETDMRRLELTLVNNRQQQIADLRDLMIDMQYQGQKPW